MFVFSPPPFRHLVLARLEFVMNGTALPLKHPDWRVLYRAAILETDSNIVRSEFPQQKRL